MLCYNRGVMGSPGELPHVYDASRLTLLEVESRMLHAFWEVTAEDYLEALAQLGPDRPRAAWILRFYGAGAGSSFDREIDLGPGSCYLRVDASPEYAEIGPRIPLGRFVPICRSNSIADAPAVHTAATGAAAPPPGPASPLEDTLPPPAPSISSFVHLIRK
jgi:hypothetical protein